MLWFPWPRCSAEQNLDVVEGIGLNTMCLCLSTSRVSVIFQLHARHCPLPLLPPAQHRSPPHGLSGCLAVSLAASGNPNSVAPCRLQLQAAWYLHAWLHRFSTWAPRWV